jgi:hypothetical protein
MVVTERKESLTHPKLGIPLRENKTGDTKID